MVFVLTVLYRLSWILLPFSSYTVIFWLAWFTSSIRNSFMVSMVVSSMSSSIPVLFHCRSYGGVFWSVSMYARLIMMLVSSFQSMSRYGGLPMISWAKYCANGFNPCNLHSLWFSMLNVLWNVSFCCSVFLSLWVNDMQSIHLISASSVGSVWLLVYMTGLRLTMFL